MSDTPTPASSTEKTITVDSRQFYRLRTFTYISIGLNVLVLAMLFIGCVMSHHHKHGRNHEFARHGGWHGCPFAMDRGGDGPRFHQFGGGGMNQGWGRPGGFGGQGPMGMGRGQGMGDIEGGGPGMMDNRQGMGPGGFGMHGMMGGPSMGPVDPSKMTDTLLDRLSTQLSLTDDQKAKVKPLIQDQVTQLQKDMEARRVAMQKAMDDTKTKLKTILNADQQKQLDAIPFPGQKPGGGTPPAPAPSK